MARNQVVTGDAPVVWKFNAGASALGVFVDKDRVWVGTQAGDVYALSHAGRVKEHYHLPAGVKALVADDRWIYAGCDNGRVYDLSRTVPTIAYDVGRKTQIFWQDIYSGTLCVSDSTGKCTVYDHEGDKSWSRKSKGRSGWMVRADDAGVYHGNGGWETAGSVTSYDWAGKKRWHQPTRGGVGFGWQERDRVYASATPLDTGWIHPFNKSNGKPGRLCHGDEPMLSCAAGDGGDIIFGADNGDAIYGFAKTGKRLWKLQTGCGSGQSMHYWQRKLYVVTGDGYLACVDVSKRAIDGVSKGSIPKARSVRRPSTRKNARRVGDRLDVARASAKGVRVRCVKVGSRIRVHPTSPGYNPGWFVQFPRDLREDGALFLVDDLVEASQGGFYRAVGEIRRTTEPPKKTKKTKKKAAKKKAARAKK